MASIFERIRGTVETIFQIGKNGKQIKSNSSDVSIVDADGSTLVPVNIAEPTATTHAATKNYVDTYYLSKPIITGNNYVYELYELKNYIDNYDSTATYTVTFSNSILSATISGNEITITAEENTTDIDITVTMTVTVSKSGYVSNYVSRDILVKNFVIYSDDSLFVYDTTYTTDSFAVIENGLIE